MILTNIKTSRIPNRVNLIFSDGSYLPLFIDDVFVLSLSKNQDIDDLKLKEIQDKSLFYLGREYALRQIAISPKIEKIVVQKLKIYFLKTKKKFSLNQNFQPTIDKIIDYLNSQKLLNQDNFVDFFINKNKSKSSAQIAFLLKSLGVDVSAYRHLLSNKDDSSIIQKILSKKKITKEYLSDFKSKSKILSSLYRRGFNSDDISNAIDCYLKLK